MPIIKMNIPSKIFYKGEYLSPKEVYRRKNISRAMRASGRSLHRKRGVCVHCGKECAVNTLARWHNDNCRKKVTE